MSGDDLVRSLVERVRGGDVGIRTLFVNAVALLTAPLHLRAFDRVGPLARTRGKPIVENHGTIEVGSRLQVSSAFCRSRFFTAKGAVLRIGDGLNANFGTEIAAKDRVEIGSRVNFGPYVVVADHDPRHPEAGARPVTIGDDVWLAARVRVGPGASIGARTVVAAGSVVEGALPADAIASGAPARVLRARRGDEQ
jgi:acetyltransferase-like isoleucine patch superfamily enzyme